MTTETGGSIEGLSCQPTCEGVNDCARADDERAGDEQIVDEE